MVFVIRDLFLTFAVMEVPAEVLKAAAKIVSQFGGDFAILGEYQGKEVYRFRFPENAKTGFPFLYLYKDGKVDFVTGWEALKIVRLLVVE